QYHNYLHSFPTRRSSDLNNELNYITNETYFLVNKFMEKEELLNNLKEGIKDNYEFYTRNITMNEINELYELKQDTYVTNLTFNEDDEIYTVEGYTKDISIIQEILKEKQ